MVHSRIIHLVQNIETSVSVREEGRLREYSSLDRTNTNAAEEYTLAIHIIAFPLQGSTTGTHKVSIQNNVSSLPVTEAREFRIERSWHRGRAFWLGLPSPSDHTWEIAT